MTLTRGRILAVIRGILEGLFYGGMAIVATIGINPTWLLLTLLGAYLALILLDQQDNLWEIGGIVAGVLLAVAVAVVSPTGLDGATPMAFAIALLILIVVRYIPAPKSQS